ncbi:hypothetical protein [Rhodoferax sp.]|uniref:hypothetical protein n=1 Tax=Rhodoferax sp. TaxID=50421 RepID=UPI0026003061|nr:hypothetical protein [Rhodoferax sp.]
MQVHQFQVSYVAEQDRILVRMNSTAGDEQSLWLTRRLMLNLFPHLDKAVHELSLSTASAVGHDGAADHAVRAYQQEETLSQSDFETPYQEVSPDDAAGPLLVTTAHYQLRNEQEMSLRFDEKFKGQTEARSIEINMVSETALALLHVLRLGLQASGWGIGGASATEAPVLRAPEPQEDDAGEWDAFTHAERPKYLN